jgi:peptidoglycan DL-endopeptidase CwlO
VNAGRGGLAKPALFGLISLITLLVVGVLLAPMLLFAGGSLEFAKSNACGSSGGSGVQPVVSTTAHNSIPANYLALFRSVGARFRVPWVILAGIGRVESDDGRTTLPGVHSGANPFGAAGPMQIGIGGAAGNTWGGGPVHPASERVSGVAIDANGDGTASVYDPADAIAGAAKYLLAHGVLDNVSGAIFAYNHLNSYVQSVLHWANTYAKGGFTVSPVSVDNAPGCLPGVGVASSHAAAVAIAFAEAQLGKPYLWGGTGPDAFDCSGLVMASYRAAGVDIPRTSEAQWAWGPRVSPSQVQPGDLVFFVGADGTRTSPGHVGLVIGGGMMIEAFAPGFPIRITRYTNSDPVGFTRPLAHRGVQVTSAQSSGAQSSGAQSSGAQSSG